MNQLQFPPALLDDLRQVEQVVMERVKSRSAVVTIAGQHLLGSGGKRLRAAMALLTAQLGTYQFDQVLHAAAAVELIHTASLVHDDLVDEAERRRGVETVHARWDHGVALMVGDYFFALAAGEMALSPDPRVITYFSHAVMTICEGELSPVMSTTPLETAVQQYYYKIGCKTAALFEAACKAGMATGGGSDAQIEQAGQFGYQIGLAFQVIDDVLDFAGNEAALGKPVGGDLRKGVITLPLIYAVAAGGGDELAAVVDTPDDEARIAWALGEVKRLGAIEQTRQEAERLVAQARAHLAGFPDTPARQLLYDIGAFTLERDR
jgi:heptaprenyl diphosphate synthase/octaprenyl-diphosphate synthase